MAEQNGFDYIVVGAGSAGCVIADRLSEDADCRVLLLQAGGRDTDPLIHIPIGIGRMHPRRLHDWGYNGEPESALNGRILKETRGKVLGGSSSINVMAYVRGNRADYDRWSGNGCPGWSYAEVLPYFRRSESWEGGADAYRGGDGPLKVTSSRSPDPIWSSMIEAGESAGHARLDDYNGARQEGFGRSQSTIGNGRRCSTAVAFLHPAKRRANLTVQTNVLTSRIIVEGKRAVGVEYLRNGQVIEARAEREIVLSAGAFNSPQLLMLSGIGPADHLRKVGIEPLVDLPGIGGNLQDHLSAPLDYQRLDHGPFRDDMRIDRMALNLVRAHLFGTGPASWLPNGLHGFMKTRPELAEPDIQFLFRGAASETHLWFPGIRAPFRDGFGIRPVLLHPESRGNVRLRSADPSSSPRIQQNFLATGNDLAALRNGVRAAREVFRQKRLDRYRGEEISPGPGASTDEQIDAWIRATAATVCHPCGTCAMGSGEHAVLDAELRVRGMESLRVVDAAAMPDLVSGNINACVIMMAEKASDLIRGRSPLAPAPVDASPAPGR
jgi:choline dehydrogenase-like flavoprotein